MGGGIDIWRCLALAAHDGDNRLQTHRDCSVIASSLGIQARVSNHPSPMFSIVRFLLFPMLYLL